MKKVFLAGILALSAIFFSGEKNQSTQIESNDVAGSFENSSINESTLWCDLIPPIQWPDPIKRPKVISLLETVIG